MATYAKAFVLTYSCGHTSVRYLTLSHKEIDRRIVAARLDECHRCTQRRIWDARDANMKEARARGLFLIEE